MRKIIHIDMDAFYASVEQRDNPSLKGKPLAVGSGHSRGVIAAASYEARKYGVRSAMPSMRAKKLCPHLEFVRPRMSVYKEVSHEIHSIFHRYTDCVEPLSLDEAFLDVTTNKINCDLAVEIAKMIKKDIREELDLIASAGISYNKFLAKIASDYRKPDGICTIHPTQAEQFIRVLPIEAFWGVGPVTAKKMHQLGIHRGEELVKWTKSRLTHHFGKMGKSYYLFARGIDNRPVQSERIRKSVGCENTLDKNITLHSSVIIELYHIATELVERIKRSQFEGLTLTLKVKYHDFTQVTRSHTTSEVLTDLDQIIPLYKELLESVEFANNPIRLLGLTVSNPIELIEPDTLESDYIQLKIPFEEE